MPATAPGLFPRQYLRPACGPAADVGVWEEGPSVPPPVSESTTVWMPLWGVQLPTIVGAVAVYFEGYDGPAADFEFAYVYGSGEGATQTYLAGGKFNHGTAQGKQGLLIQCSGYLQRWFALFGRLPDGGAQPTKLRLRALISSCCSAGPSATYGPDINPKF